MTELYRAYYPFLFSFGFKHSGDKELTKDLLHELFLDLWNKRSSVAAVEHVGFYLRTWLKRKIRQAIPGQHNNEPTEQDLPAECSYEELLVRLQSREEMQEKVRRALQRLSPRQREVIRMKFFEERSYEEMAAAGDTTPRTIYNQVYEALKILRKYLSVLVHFLRGM